MVSGIVSRIVTPDSHSTWDMTAQDFMRLDGYFRDVDKYHRECAMLHFSFLLNYVVTLDTIYNYFRPLMNGDAQKKTDEEFLQIRNIIITDDWVRLKKDGEIIDAEKLKATMQYRLLIRIEKLHKEVMEIRQRHRAGIRSYVDRKNASDDNLKPPSEQI